MRAREGAGHREDRRNQQGVGRQDVDAERDLGVRDREHRHERDGRAVTAHGERGTQPTSDDDPGPRGRHQQRVDEGRERHHHIEQPRPQ